jgi:hypothetical protein
MFSSYLPNQDRGYPILFFALPTFVGAALWVWMLLGGAGL